MRLDADFQSARVDEGDELFPNGIFEFNITKLLEHVKSNPDSFPVERVKVTDLPAWSSSDLDEATIQKADLSSPIVLAEISPARFNVIDGNHRLERARRDGAEVGAWVAGLCGIGSGSRDGWCRGVLGSQDPRTSNRQVQ